MWMVWEREEKKDNEEVNQIMKKKIAKERKVIPDPSCVNSFTAAATNTRIIRLISTEES